VLKNAEFHEFHSDSACILCVVLNAAHLVTHFCF